MSRHRAGPKHYGIPEAAGAELVATTHPRYTPRHCDCLPCAHRLPQHVSRAPDSGGVED